MSTKHVTIAGAGLVGSLLAIWFRKKGLDVDVFEKRPDPRKTDAQGRSINLVVTSRGLKALEEVGIKEEILELTVPVSGRMIHQIGSDPYYQPYGRSKDECNYSVSRSELNNHLIQKALDLGAQIHFKQEVQDVDFQTKTLKISSQDRVKFDFLFGTDGIASPVRNSLCENSSDRPKNQIESLNCDYKELLIPSRDGEYPIDKNSLHIWPHGAHMLMALPNQDGSFTVTLYLPEGESPNFSELDSKEKITQFFQTFYPQLLELIPNLEESFLENPVGRLGTVRCGLWTDGESTVLLGDAAHGIVPFFGQGMNSGFEDVSVLMSLLDKHPNQWASAFREFQNIQIPNGNAIADMAIENYKEMAEKVGDERFLFLKRVENELEKRFPTKFLSRYSMVTHTLIPYKVAMDAGEIGTGIIERLADNISSIEQFPFDKAENLIESEFYSYLTERGHSTQVYF